MREYIGHGASSESGQMIMFKRYKEIWFGLGLGLLMWVVDAVMHVQLGHEIHSSGLVEELFRPGATQLVFRAVFVLIAIGFGVTLWRSNWRERELRAFEEAVIAFHRQIDSPALRIVNHARMLAGRPSVERDALAVQLLEAVAQDAQAVDELSKKYLRLSALVLEGRTEEAVDLLRSIEAWGDGLKPTTFP